MAEEQYESNLNLEEISDVLTAWFEAEGRKLPWRTEKTPYRVWISEIMLQQTRVEAVKPYFERFMKRLPDVDALAQISQEELNKLWEGLGYYSRARNLKKAAQIIQQEYGGRMPADYEKLLALPGIGSYTAGAIASFAFRLPAAAVDGNVLRVMARLTGSTQDISQPRTKKYFEDWISAFLRTGKCRPDAFNAAIMELGAIVCVPGGEPQCFRCPLEAVCAARRNGMTDCLPVKAAKKARRVEEKTVFLILSGDRVLIERRPAKGLLAGLYQFPNEPGYCTAKQAAGRFCVGGRPLSPDRIQEGPQAKHIFTHVEWHMRSFVIRLSEDMEAGLLEAMQGAEHVPERRFVSRQTLVQEIAMPSAFAAFGRFLLE